jgi:hypothetical protein
MSPENKEAIVVNNGKMPSILEKEECNDQTILSRKTGAYFPFQRRQDCRVLGCHPDDTGERS